MVELFILFRVRRTAKVAPLLALPLLFVLWANLHIQFVYGLAVLGLFLIEVLLAQPPSVSLYPRHRPNISLAQVSLLLLARPVAIFITPIILDFIRRYWSTLERPELFKS